MDVNWLSGVIPVPSIVCTLLQEARWPGTLTLQLRFWGGGADNARFYTRSTAFPALSLAGKPPPPHPAGGAALAGAAAGGSATSGGPAQAIPAAGNSDITAMGAAAALRGDSTARRTETAPGPGVPLLAHLAEHRASGRAVGAPPADALEAALRANAEGLCRSSSSLQPPAAVLVEVRRWMMHDGKPNIEICRLPAQQLCLTHIPQCCAYITLMACREGMS